MTNQTLSGGNGEGGGQTSRYWSYDWIISRAETYLCLGVPCEVKAVGLTGHRQSEGESVMIHHVVSHVEELCVEAWVTTEEDRGWRENVELACFIHKQTYIDSKDTHKPKQSNQTPSLVSSTHLLALEDFQRPSEKRQNIQARQHPICDHNVLSRKRYWAGEGLRGSVRNCIQHAQSVAQARQIGTVWAHSLQLAQRKWSLDFYFHRLPVNSESHKLMWGKIPRSDPGPCFQSLSVSVWQNAVRLSVSEYLV